MKKGLRKKGLGGALLAAGLLTTGSALAGATIKMDDTKWLSVGAGIRSSFSAQDNAAGADTDMWTTSFALDNVRLYVNGQVHENIKFEFNTECNNCTSNAAGQSEIFVLDAIAKFEFSDLINIWTGRLLVPSDRAELDGPFYQNTYEFNRTPFFPNDQFDSLAGKYGRDDGVVVWGALTADKRLTYSIGAFDGATAVNQNDNLLYAGRVSYNFLNVEQNPGYYTSSTYYGNAGDIFTVAFATQYQENGAGTTAAASMDFWGMSTDVLYETVLSSGAVVTAEAQWKRFELSGGGTANTTDTGMSNIFEGDAYTGTLLYLMPGEMGIGRLQPYVRYTNNDSKTTTINDMSEWEGGLNYIIDGHNAKVSVWYQYGDINTGGRNYLEATSGGHASAIKMAVQLQI